MPEMSLMPRQRDALVFIARYITAHKGVAPSFDEIATELDIRSKSGVSRIVAGLEARGYITYLPNKPRSITLKSKHRDARAGFFLPEKVQETLSKYCREHEDDEASVVADAVAIFLDQREQD